MTRQELLQFHEDFCKEMIETTKQKNNDYSSAMDNAFGNLSAVERLGIATTEKGILVRMTDKISRINTFIQGHSYQVKDESVMDTLKDLANYTILLAAVIKDKQKEQQTAMSSGGIGTTHFNFGNYVKRKNRT